MSTLRFKHRPAAAGIFFVASYGFGDEIEQWEPEPGNTATLHTGDITVTVQITEAVGRKYKGSVIGFERWNEYEYEGVKPEDVVEFSYEHVFGCSR